MKSNKRNEKEVLTGDAKHIPNFETVVFGSFVGRRHQLEFCPMANAQFFNDMLDFRRRHFKNGGIIKNFRDRILREIGLHDFFLHTSSAKRRSV
ncbi:hypothetical protein A3B32_01675 [Candidatus Uhrbacteria bacterium RIFCSPLOWO2_01_FULL_53_9]|uniref:Uncharacterized protein n=1 Tax=Candidatus Uhrbacteria bacterium RIFCSPLOWO2_01_FULL_53_9 TaxID=1802403 RepID=A0A1F7V011_9BACT|nr:MAG: hypothetical protein A3B32_01675 [Candidatus Uhrbacteria bacterium RIFCSPLOWO2_01_FULL_53_9]